VAKENTIPSKTLGDIQKLYQRALDVLSSSAVCSLLPDTKLSFEEAISDLDMAQVLADSNLASIIAVMHGIADPPKVKEIPEIGPELARDPRYTVVKDYEKRLENELAQPDLSEQDRVTKGWALKTAQKQRRRVEASDRRQRQLQEELKQITFYDKYLQSSTSRLSR